MYNEEEIRPCIDNCSCESEKDSLFMKHCAGGGRKILAHTYVPWQVYDKAYCPREALTKGTLFPNLWGVYKIPR